MASCEASGAAAGNLCSILVSGFVCTVISLIKPDNFDWKATREITMIDPEDTGARLLSHYFGRSQFTAIHQVIVYCLCAACSRLPSRSPGCNEQGHQ